MNCGKLELPDRVPKPELGNQYQDLPVDRMPDEAEPMPSNGHPMTGQAYPTGG
jgi:hypothetical protein